MSEERANRKSMTRRLILWLTGAATGFWLIAAGLGVSVMNDEFGEIFDGSLQQTAERLVPLVVGDLERRGAHSSPRHIRSETDEPGEEYLVYQVRAADGQILIRSHDAPEAPFDAPLKRGFATSGAYRFYLSLIHI